MESRAEPAVNVEIISCHLKLVLDLQKREYADSTIYSALRVLKTILRKHAVQNENYEEMIHYCYLTVHRLESKVLLEDESA